MKITRDKYPRIFLAFDDIIADNVASTTITKTIQNRLNKGYEVENPKINVEKAEAFLAELNDEDREIITMGDQDEALERFGKVKGFSDTNKLLYEFFNNM